MTKLGAKLRNLINVPKSSRQDTGKVFHQTFGTKLIISNYDRKVDYRQRIGLSGAEAQTVMKTGMKHAHGVIYQKQGKTYKVGTSIEKSGTVKMEDTGITNKKNLMNVLKNRIPQVSGVEKLHYKKATRKQKKQMRNAPKHTGKLNVGVDLTTTNIKRR